MNERYLNRMEQNLIETGELWWVHFPFSDCVKYKRRPAIILEDDTIAILTLYVTSKNKPSPYSIELTDWKEAGLSEPSWARIDKIVRIGESNLDTHIGRLSKNDFPKIMELVGEIRLNKRHDFSLVAIQNSENKFLQLYDERWESWLFPYFRYDPEDNKSFVSKKTSELLGFDVSPEFVVTAEHCKYSVSDDCYKIYKHRLYSIKIKDLPANMKQPEFELNGRKCSWMSVEEMAENERIMEVNSDIVAFVNTYCK